MQMFPLLQPLLLLLAASRSSGFSILESSSPVTARDDSALELTCSSDEPWAFCKWTYAGGSSTCSRAWEHANEFCDGGGQERIRWKGDPSMNGNQCILFIEKPEKADAGEWRCK